MRLRTIKPGFFKNEDLLALPPLTRLLFAGLWCYCDRDGRCEDRPRRMKLEILPGDECDVDVMLDDLARAGFLVRYTHAGERLLQVTKFSEHQRPHKNEQESALPPMSGDSTTKAVPQHNHGGAKDALSLGSGEWDPGSGDLSLGERPCSPAASPVERPVRAARKAASGDHAGLIAHFKAEYERTQGTPYLVNGSKDGAAAKRLLAAFPAPELLERATRFLEADDEFLNRTDRSLAMFAQQVNRPVVRGVEIVSANGKHENNHAGIRAYAARAAQEAP